MSTKYQSNVEMTSKEDLVTETDDVKRKSVFFVYTLTFLSTIGGFLFGYDTGVVSGAMLLINKEFQLTDLWHEAIVSSTIGMALVFALIGGWLSDKYGRKPAILVASIVFTFGSVIMGLANNKEMLLAGRLVVGIGVGIASMSVPVYISECANPEQRGVLVSSYQLLITLGLLVASIVAGCFADVKDGWRYMLGLAAVPAVLQFCGFLCMPETPRWLASKKRYSEAMKVLVSIRGSGVSVEQEMAGIRAVCEDKERELEEQAMLNGGRLVILQVLCSKSVRRALLLGCFLHAIQQLSGINTVMYYSASIIRMAGVEDETIAIWLSAVVAAVNFVCSFLGLFLVNRVGRRKLTLVSLAGVFACLIVLGVGFELISSENIPVTFAEQACGYAKTCGDCIDSSRGCGFCFYQNNEGLVINSTCSPIDIDTGLPSAGLCMQSPNLLPLASPPTWADGWCPSKYYWLPVLALSLYLVSFAPGMGPMPWTITSEIYPLWARGTCTSITTCTNWSMNLVVSASFLSLAQAITKYGAFYLYAGIALFGLIILWLILPETKGRTLEEMESLFLSPWFALRSRTCPGQSLGVHNVQVHSNSKKEESSCDSHL